MDCSLPTPLSIGLSRQEYWSGLPFPPPGYLPDPGLNLRLFMSLALAGREATGALKTDESYHISQPTWQRQLFFLGQIPESIPSIHFVLMLLLLLLLSRISRVRLCATP